jgi:hypothetical protein
MATDSKMPVPDDLAWIGPNYRPTPGEGLARIEALCALAPDLFGAIFVVLATHPTVPRDLLVAALRRFRSDAQTFTQEDMVGLVTAVGNGARQAFDAVSRTRRNNQRRNGASLPWA